MSLVSLAKIKTYLGISGNLQDDFLNQQNAIIQNAVELYCERSLEERTWEQTFYRDDIYPSKELMLYQYPLKDVPTVEVSGEAFTDFRTSKQDAFIVNVNGWGSYCGDIVVTYTAGYATDSAPAVIEGVILGLIQERYNKKNAGIDLNFGSDVQGISIPGTISVQFDYSLTNNDEKSVLGSILGNYRNSLIPFKSERTITGSGKIKYVEEVP